MKKRRILRPRIRDQFYRRRYLIPNGVTVGNMFCGFLSIVYASSGRFEKAALAILFAILLDGLDGRVARRLNATSRFGVEFDSLSDLVSFGVAPALMVYFWSLREVADEFGVFVTFVYAMCAASRLARFNISPENLKSFLGLPSPGAAGVVAAIVYFKPVIEPSIALAGFSAAVMLLLGFLMVSKIGFFSIKKLKVRGLRLFARVSVGALIALIWYNPRIGLLTLASLYALSGPYLWVRTLMTGVQPQETSDESSTAQQPPAPLSH